jgi:hypothetical protein
MKILLTVSPVPMVATASGQHVLVANGRTKNTLRAVAADLAERRDDVDYFPGYELVREPPFGNAFFEENMRAVTREGVAYVMNHFLGAHDEAFGAGTSGASGVTRAGTGSRKGQTEEELVCEEILLDAAAPR